MSSKELPVSSDESSTIDVGCEPMPSPINPWGDMNVDDIPLKIVDHFSDSETDIVITDVSKKPSVIFNPLTYEDHKFATMKFNLVISEKSHWVEYNNIGKLCASPPVITQSTRGNGACIFNSYSMLLTGRDTFSAIICHMVCNYISNPVKYKWLQAYIPSQFKSGKDYIMSSGMHNFTTWGTDVEIIAMAQISGFDMYVYTKKWWLVAI